MPDFLRSFNIESNPERYPEEKDSLISEWAHRHDATSEFYDIVRLLYNPDDPNSAQNLEVLHQLAEDQAEFYPAEMENAGTRGIISDGELNIEGITIYMALISDYTNLHETFETWTRSG
ncbi:MAG: hypothetical protein ABEJ56_00900 [Candidatus Nanohaloarchaea archaeon]